MIMLKENTVRLMEKLYLVLNIRPTGIFPQPHKTQEHLEYRML